MGIRAVIFDIGGVLEVTPATGWQERWAARLGLGRAEMDARLGPRWRGGNTGVTSLPEIERRVAAALGLGAADLAELMAEAWAEHLGTLNTKMTSYLAALRPRYLTGIPCYSPALSRPSPT